VTATNRRAAIAMSEQEVADLLAGRHHMSVATIGPGGQPHLVAMWYGFLDGVIGLWTYGRSQKVTNVRRDPRITCLVETGSAYNELRGVELAGTARVVDDPEAVLELGLSVYERYTGEVTESARDLVAHMGAKRVAVLIDVHRTVSWDHRKL
jgi:PPOX class probable F420-dependent enzyme